MAVRTAHAVIGEGGRMGSAVDGINDRRPVPTRVVLVGGRVLLRVGDGGDQTCGSVGERGGIAQRINDLRQLAFGVIGKVRDALGAVAVWLRRCDRRQVAIRVIGIGGHVPQRIVHGQHFAETVVGVGSGSCGVGVQLLEYRGDIVVGIFC